MGFYLRIEEPEEKVKRKRLVVSILVSLLLLAGILIGYCIGFYVHREEKTSHQDPTKFHEIIKNEIDSKQIEKTFRKLASNSHRAGGPYSESYAAEIASTWKRFGLDDVEIKRYNVMLSEPTRLGCITVKNKVSNEVIYESHSNETVLIPDENVHHIVPFVAYSASGDVTGQLVYVNYGTMDDFMYLRQNNITLKGKIAIIRYGKIFRANKVTLAEQAGAVGVILYSDVADYSRGVIKYPNSWWLPPDGVQRGTINHLDAEPQTIGFPAIDGIYRTPENETATPKIPVQPISYTDAAEIMRHMDGPIAPAKFRGGMNITYRLYSTSASHKLFNLNVDVVNKPNTTIYNVIGKIRGTIEPDRYVMLGNHHDAWVMGAFDPTSGTAIMAEIIRAIGIASRKGWKPRRSIIFGSWDAEEYGLIGSTEWLEDNSAFVSNQVVAYLNVGTAIQGNYTLKAKASFPIASVLFQAADKVQDPDDPHGNSVFTTWQKKNPDVSHANYPKTLLPGSGSDYKTFVVRFGIPVTDIRYTYDTKVFGEIPSAPTYHSLHDTFYNAKRFVDPQMKYCATIGKIWAVTATTLVDSIIIPFNFSDFARRLDVCEKRFMNAYSSYMSPAHIKQFNAVVQSIERFSIAAKAFHSQMKQVNDPLKIRSWNDKMMAVERAFVASLGLRGRPYIKHLLYGPSKYNSYVGDCFPALVDDIMGMKYYNQSNQEEMSRDISQLYYHILQATQILND